MQYDELYHLEIKFFHTIGATKFWLHRRFILCWEQKRDSICPSLQFGIHSNFKSHGLHPGAHLNLISLKISKFLLIDISLSLLYICEITDFALVIGWKCHALLLLGVQILISFLIAPKESRLCCKPGFVTICNENCAEFARFSACQVFYIFAFKLFSNSLHWGDDI